MSKDTPLDEALRALADPTPPESLWEEIARRMDRDQDREPMEPELRRAPEKTRFWRRGWVPSAIAASFALGVWLTLAPTTERPTGFLDPAIAELLIESQSLEALVNSRPRALSATGDVLLIRIADVDARLNDAWLAESGNHAIQPLLRRRVALLHSLADLEQRSATPYNPALRPAVLSGDVR